jgi:gliding motility-associated-like protein
MKGLFPALFFTFLSGFVSAQQYTLNGSATQDDCHSYTLTRPVNAQSGSVWNNIKIDLNQSFSFNFDVFLGALENGIEGADGIVFVLQPISTSVGSSGGGLGFSGITPSVGVTLDTYQNSSPDNDPAYDHIAIQRNGDLNHSSANNLAGQVPISATTNNVEDGNWHTLKITWDAVTKKMEAFFDGVSRLSVINDFVNTTFGGNPLVFWGFTGSTGGLNNLQRFKTALTPSFHFGPAQNRCINEPIQFFDSTISFTTIASFSWNFGDGSPVDNVNLNPIHAYTTAGDFTVVQTVTGADGCVEINTQQVRIGSKPVAAFTYNDSCVLNTIQFSDVSTVAVGSINNWYWQLDNAVTSVSQNPLHSYPTNGLKTIKLAVKSLEGCASDTLIKTVRIYARPVADFSFTDSICLGSPMLFTNNSTWVDGILSGWNWNFGDGSPAVFTQNTSHIYTTPGVQTVQLFTTGIHAGCAGIIQKTVFVAAKPIAHARSVVVCQFAPVTLQDSSYTTDGLTITGWWWNLGNGQFSNQQNPVVTYNTPGPITIQHVVYNSRGCVSDTFTQTIQVSGIPVAKFGYSTVLCSNIPVIFSDSSTISNGTITQWNWQVNGAPFSNVQNPVQIFSAGPQTIQLTVTSSAGCAGNPVIKTFVVNPKPDISMQFNNACRFAVVDFTGADNNGTGIASWKWNFGDGAIALTNPAQHVYNANGAFPVSLLAVSNAGCNSDTLKQNIIIYSTNAFAGNDTIAASAQPIQLNASGGLSYEWIPSTGLNDAFIANPIATLTQDQQYILKAFTPQGCISYDTIQIKIYKGPEIYLPTAFTPNGDGKNDIFIGVPIGIKEFKYLKVFNRWGQELFSSTDYRKGWNGEWKGQKQENGVYLVMALGIDFTNKVIKKKGTVVLIR